MRSGVGPPKASLRHILCPRVQYTRVRDDPALANRLTSEVHCRILASARTSGRFPETSREPRKSFVHHSCQPHQSILPVLLATNASASWTEYHSQPSAPRSRRSSIAATKPLMPAPAATSEKSSMRALGSTVQSRRPASSTACFYSHVPGKLHPRQARMLLSRLLKRRPISLPDIVLNVQAKEAIALYPILSTSHHPNLHSHSPNYSYRRHSWSFQIGSHHGHRR